MIPVRPLGRRAVERKRRVAAGVRSQRPRGRGPPRPLSGSRCSKRALAGEPPGSKVRGSGERAPADRTRPLNATAATHRNPGNWTPRPLDPARGPPYPSGVPPATRCLLVYPKFSDASFWNFADIMPLAGRKYITQPLGLLTVAALLPKSWECRLVDLNARDLSEADLAWADLVMTGGMITQQLETLRLIRELKARGKTVVVGGPDATSQPALYEGADFLVLGEAELTVPAFLAAWEHGERTGRFAAGEAKADVERSPIPRFDLLRFSDYLYVGVQLSRGCPYNCEFCDIIELYGRVPRLKTPARMFRELEALLALGYRGHVDFVDDNFIGDKRAVKAFLRELVAWSEARGWPFYFSTEATVTLAADPELLELMRRADFRFVFVGIETPDPELLRQTQKKQNTLAPLADAVRKLNEAGMMVYAGFILGFDGEKAGAGEALAACVEETRVATAMTGLLTSLPNTQLDRRLAAEGRLLTRARGTEVRPEEVDQMTGGLNFLTRRPRAEVLGEYRAALARLYDPANYFARVRGFLEWFKPHGRHRPSPLLFPRFAWTFLRVSAYFLLRPALAGPYLRTLLAAAGRGPKHLSLAVILAGF
ncbi:radical SAM protein, partial [bacterium]